MEILKPEIDEKSLGNRGDASRADELVTLIATAKADAVIQKILVEKKLVPEKTILLTADQVVIHNSKILEKPASIAEARKFIESYVQSQCSTVGSIILTDLESKKRIIGTSTSTIYFGNISAEVIEKILIGDDVLYCAGGLMVEHPLLQPYIERIDGSLNSLMGLCTTLLYSLLDELDNNTTTNKL